MPAGSLLPARPEAPPLTPVVLQQPTPVATRDREHREARPTAVEVVAACRGGPREGQTFADYLGEHCADVGIPDKIRLGCGAAEVTLAVPTAVGLATIAAELVAAALRHAFPGERGGRICVGFGASAYALVLMVEDSGLTRAWDTVAMPRFRRAGALSALLGGELTLDDVVAGTRCLVTLPRRRALPVVRVSDAWGRPIESHYASPDRAVKLHHQDKSARRAVDHAGPGNAVPNPTDPPRPVPHGGEPHAL